MITGGHLTPAQAVIEELKKESKWEIFYLGREYSLEGQKIPSVESRIVPKLGVKFVSIPAGRLQRQLSPRTFLSLAKVPLAFFYSFFLLLKIRPDVILSFGGYVSIPVVIASWFLGIPILTHEQTIVSGLANQINGYFAKKILVSYSESLKHFPEKKTILTGNPIRREVFKRCPSYLTSHISHEKLPLLYITGGNQGAQIINKAVVEVLPELLQRYRLIHQCGKLDYGRIKDKLKQKLKQKLQKRYFLTDYLESKDIGWVLNEADLIISRAGANIVVELAVLGKPAILIPLPWAAEGEQAKNAQMLVDAGAAVILPQKQLSGKRLQMAIEKMMVNLRQYQTRAAKAKKLVKPNAAKEVVRQITSLIQS